MGSSLRKPKAKSSASAPDTGISAAPRTNTNPDSGTSSKSANQSPANQLSSNSSVAPPTAPTDPVPTAESSAPASAQPPSSSASPAASSSSSDPPAATSDSNSAPSAAAASSNPSSSPSDSSSSCSSSSSSLPTEASAPAPASSSSSPTPLPVSTPSVPLPSSSSSGAVMSDGPSSGDSSSPQNLAVTVTPAPDADSAASSTIGSANSTTPGTPTSQDEFKPLSVDFPPNMTAGNRGRRLSVSAESDRTPAETFKKVVIPKSEEQLARIRQAIKKSILFMGLDVDQTNDIFNAMEEVKVNPNDTVIKQFELGDYFYVIDSGKYDVFKRESPSSEQKKVFEYIESGSFGELALMYNCPRAATVVAVTPGTLWRVDRETFRHIIIDSSASKRKLFEEFLESIPILTNLSKQERAQVADCLETVNFGQGDYVIKQGEEGDQVYFIIKGRAIATQTATTGGEAVQVGSMKTGQYFGERSLITREPRAANVVAVDDMQCAAMDRSAFERLLGDVKEIMARQIKQYVKADDVVKGNGGEQKQEIQSQNSASSSAVATASQ